VLQIAFNVELADILSDSYCVKYDMIRYDTIEEFNTDSKAEYTA